MPLCPEEEDGFITTATAIAIGCIVEERCGGGFGVVGNLNDVRAHAHAILRYEGRDL